MLKLEHIYKRYDFTKVLDDICMELPSCGLISIIGPSGCGKTTLLQIIGGIDSDFQGEIYYNQKKVKHHLHRYRKYHISFLFQRFHLLMWLNVKSNIFLSRYFHFQYKKDYKLDIQDFENFDMTALSFGQRQRIAYLRAYMQKGNILLCDEPTGSLDEENKRVLMNLLKEESKSRLVIMVSHDQELIEDYSDEIYMMNDGKIIDHRIINSCQFVEVFQSKQAKYPFSCLQMAYASFLSHRKRSIQMIFGLTLSFVCILTTLSLSQGLEKQIKDYIYTIVPSSGISFQKQDKQNIDKDLINQLHHSQDISRIHFYLDHYENMGLSFQKKRYEESKTLFISDDSSPYQYLQLKYGTYPKNDQEIILSLSTAKHLLNDTDVTKCLNKKVYSWYKKDKRMYPIEFLIVGVSTNTTTFDTFYQRENAYIHLLEKQEDFDSLSRLGMIYVKPHKDRHTVFTQLQKDYKQLRFQEVGETTSKHVSDTMDKVEMILMIFSFLAMISSVFLIGEVMFLNVVQKKKDLAIMRCFGATSFDTLKIVFYEAGMIVLGAQIFGCLLYVMLLTGFNEVAKNILMSQTTLFHIQGEVIIKVCLSGWMISLLSQLIPLIYVYHFNTIDALKS